MNGTHLRSANSAATEGVYYARTDCAGFWRRLIVECVDLAAAFGIVLAAAAALTLVLSLPTVAESELLVLMLAVWFTYFVLVKGSRLQTLGYRLARVRMVDLQGATPGFLPLTVRFLFTMFGPVNFLIDFFWITTDPQRQTLRDKLAHTYVIRRGAQPAGHGPIIYASYFIFLGCFVFREVRQSPAPPRR